uniref:Uncharacterized protein n=1 Tax=Physcomitrium patens TaxID=3218 RepID=A0A2K1L8C1_PHYPA|nr:hypothetical protein PHYPA_000710 [Physcomitrium patens]
MRQDWLHLDGDDVKDGRITITYPTETQQRDEGNAKACRAPRDRKVLLRKCCQILLLASHCHEEAAILQPTHPSSRAFLQPRNCQRYLPPVLSPDYLCRRAFILHKRRIRLCLCFFPAGIHQHCVRFLLSLRCHDRAAVEMLECGKRRVSDWHPKWRP